MSGGVLRCDWKRGTYRCPGYLEAYTDGLGRLKTWCLKCARREAGVCADCPRRVRGKLGWSTHCEGCRERRRRALDAMQSRKSDDQKRRDRERKRRERKAKAPLAKRPVDRQHS